MKKVKKNIWILREVHEAARDLFNADAIDVATMLRFDALCFRQGSCHSNAGASGEQTGQDSV